MHVHTLKVPGATLRYETRGSGPALLLLPGGGADAAVWDPLADTLADHFTVVACDPRGTTRSPLDGPPADQSPAEQADDAALLLAAVTDEPAYVLGISAGAIVAVDLLQRHPALVRRVVAHEPPLVELLPDAAEQRSFFASVVEAHRERGVEAAMAVMAAGTGGGDAGAVRAATPPGASAAPPPRTPRRRRRCSGGCRRTRRSSSNTNCASSPGTCPTSTRWPRTPTGWCRRPARSRAGCSCDARPRRWRADSASGSPSSPADTSAASSGRPRSRTGCSTSC